VHLVAARGGGIEEVLGDIDSLLFESGRRKGQGKGGSGGLKGDLPLHPLLEGIKDCGKVGKCRNSGNIRPEEFCQCGAGMSAPMGGQIGQESQRSVKDRAGQEGVSETDHRGTKKSDGKLFP
jgi:hypothetical protein